MYRELPKIVASYSFSLSPFVVITFKGISVPFGKQQSCEYISHGMKLHEKCVCTKNVRLFLLLLVCLLGKRLKCMNESCAVNKNETVLRLRIVSGSHCAGFCSLVYVTFYIQFAQSTILHT